MFNRRGRPPLDDRVALRRVAEYLVDVEERGGRCSVRAAILRTSGQVVGNSPDAVLWRLQRKWRRDGQALLAEARRPKATRRNGAMLGVAREMRARTLTADLVSAGMASALERAMRTAQLHEEMVRGGGLVEMACATCS